MGIRTTACSFKQVNETSVSIKKGIFLDKLRDYHILKEGYFPK
jgi:hypothetical protein